MSDPNLKYFTYSHLPDKLLKVTKPLCELAFVMDDILPDSAEKSAGLRKLLGAKHLLVRAMLEEND